MGFQKKKHRENSIQKGRFFWIDEFLRQFYLNWLVPLDISVAIKNPPTKIIDSTDNIETS